MELNSIHRINNFEDLNAATYHRKKETNLFITLICLLIISIILTHWLRFNLFYGTDQTDIGWETRSLLGTLYLIFSSCLPVVVWSFVLYLIDYKFPRILNLKILFIIIILAIMAIELDFRWYQLSHQHATLNEIYSFLWEADSWEKHYGISNRSINKFCLLTGLSILALFILVAFTKIICRLKIYDLLYSKSTVFSKKLIAIVLLSLVLIDSLIVGYAKSEGYRQWIQVSNRNPFRVSSLENFWMSFFKNDKSLQSANEFYKTFKTSTTTPNESNKQSSPIPTPLFNAKHDYNIVLIAVEGFNHGQVDSASMPFWNDFSKNSIIGNNHYSTGNCTEYGIIGLLHGLPPYFFKGNETVPWRRIPGWKKHIYAQSRYIETLNDKDYQTKIISWFVTEWAELGMYLGNFSEKPYETEDDWELIPKIADQLALDGKHFIFTYYGGTHFPYIHKKKYTKFKPEVPEDFDFFSWDLNSYRQQIINRYRNCLLELDDWLQTLLSEIDLTKTIIVITGDHGEAMFENGLLSHASSLENPQIKTPLLIYAPGLEHHVVNEITSHIDVMPTILQMLNIDNSNNSLERSILQRYPYRTAIAAMNNRPGAPKDWAIIDKKNKIYLSFNKDKGFSIVGIKNNDDSDIQLKTIGELDRNLFSEIFKYEKAFLNDNK